MGGSEVDRAADLVTARPCRVAGGLPGAEIVGFHGQTLAHDPRGRGTLQVGDGAALARALGRPVVWDFRSADVALGGEGRRWPRSFTMRWRGWRGFWHRSRS